MVPGDEARGLVPNPVVEVERLVLEAGEAKKQAAESLRSLDEDGARKGIADAIKRADQAMYLAKRAGKNRVVGA